MATNGSFLDKIKHALTGGTSAFDGDEDYYRARHAPGQTAGGAAVNQTMGYDAARPAYQVGHVAGTDDAYAGRSFDDAEADLRRGYETHARGAQPWSAVRGHARDAYARGQEQRLVLSEEQLRLGKRHVRAGEVNVRTTVETERVHERVPLMHEEVSVERRPLSAADASGADLTIGEETLRVPLTREEAVVEKKVVPTEEVVVRTNTVTENQTVEDTVRRERLETEGLDAQQRGARTPGRNA
jgi:uncharacterized protein (TIGR02271 family)